MTQQTCRCCGQPIEVVEQISALEMWTKVEAKILRELEKGSVVETRYLAKQVYGFDIDGYKHADTVKNKISVHVGRIRDKLRHTDLGWTLPMGSKKTPGYRLQKAPA